ncbi:MAG: hypothetical protein Q9182_005359 [Xanthomendoza sp. 2 TL-2023]
MVSPECTRQRTQLALFDRQHLQDVVSKFRENNETLERILQFGMVDILRHIAQYGPGLQNLRQDQDAVALGLTTWAEIKQIKNQPERIDKDLSITDCTLDVIDSKSVLGMGTASIELSEGSKWSKPKIVKQGVFVEYKTLPPILGGFASSEVSYLDARVEKRINQLANLLSTAGSRSLGTLPFKGFVREAEHRRYPFLFEEPRCASVELMPESLHQMIESPAFARLWSLLSRFKLASKLSKMIGTFHMFEWVLKGFQSHSIIFCSEASTKEPQITQPYLAGFEYIRPISGSTVGQPLDTIGRNMLYCHSDLQEELECSKIHDLYSLGVVLLEIGLWVTVRQLLKFSRPSKPQEIRNEYIGMAKNKLPLRMGEAYTEAVVGCLESRYKHEAIRPDIFLNLFDKEVVQKVSARQLLS